MPADRLAPMMMSLRSSAVVLALSVAGSVFAAEPIDVADTDWPWWRGHNRDGVARTADKVPLSWGENRNIHWKVPVPGRGHSSPTVVGSLVFLTTSDTAKKTQSVLAFDRATGKPAWTTVVNTGGFPAGIHEKNTHASGSVASDGKRVFALFYNHDAVQTVALDFKGEILWNKHVKPYAPRVFEFGYGCSTVIEGDHVIVAGDYEKGGFLAALNRETGAEAWRAKRPGNSLNWSTPSVATIGGKRQILIGGFQMIASYSPKDGALLWKAPGATAKASCGSPVWDEGRVYMSSGYPERITSAVEAGTGKILWTNQDKSYEQSLLAHKGYLYTLNDNGIARCWRGRDGKEMWSARLGGPVSASPVLVGDRIYVANERGKFFVFKADPEAFTKLGESTLGSQIMATPAFCGDRIYARVIARQGGVQEYLYCIGEK